MRNNNTQRDIRARGLYGDVFPRPQNQLFFPSSIFLGWKISEIGEASTEETGFDVGEVCSACVDASSSAICPVFFFSGSGRPERRPHYVFGLPSLKVLCVRVVSVPHFS